MFVFDGENIVDGFAISLFQSFYDMSAFAVYVFLPFYQDSQDYDAKENPLDDPDGGLDFVGVITELIAIVCDEIFQIRSDEMKVVGENRYGVHDESLVVIGY